MPHDDHRPQMQSRPLFATVRASFLNGGQCYIWTSMQLYALYPEFLEHNVMSNSEVMTGFHRLLARLLAAEDVAVASA